MVLETLEEGKKAPTPTLSAFSTKIRRTPRGSCNRTLLRRVLRRFFNSKCFLEGFLEGAKAPVRAFSKDKVLRRVLRRERLS